ncbi:hypothetical protein [Actinotignum sanguinis]|uniref:hypothetical protein n=1 Tax=Actinotignum sanguinis TaxID=1445614 RepID=UPI0025508C52|nr:hypothetical protein [Actinotignum sanguinis]MDK8656360.1 hypothetical protein [Actinotignum sanguinis]
MNSGFEKLAAVVDAKSRVTLDHEKVGERLGKLVTQRLGADLDELRSEVGALGHDKLVEVKNSVDESLDKLVAVGEKISEIERRVTFVGIGRLSLVLLPVFAAFIMVGGLVWGVSSVFGVGPLFAWAWGLFVASQVWWHKPLIALATLSVAAGFVWLVLWVARWIYDNLR